MRYVMRAGDLTTGLLLSGNLCIQLIALHTDKPYRSYLANSIYISLAALD